MKIKVNHQTKEQVYLVRKIIILYTNKQKIYITMKKKFKIDMLRNLMKGKLLKKKICN